MKPPIFNPDWPAEVQALYRHDMQEIWDPKLAPQIWNQYHNQLDVYRAIAGAKPLQILDVGCAQGTLALLLAESGHEVCAMDIRQHFLDYAAARHEKGAIRFLCGNALEIEPGAKFDLIFANQIVEHLVYPLEFTRRLAGWLKPGGRLVMTTPNWHYFVNTLPSFSQIGPASQYEHLQFTADGDGHFFAYKAGELLEVMQAAGLKDIRAEYFETPWISGHYKVRYLHPWLPKAALRLFDRATLALPGIGARLAHQLMTIGTMPA